ncbi:hypothetical protein [Escherichia coli]|nr:hypothetical protein [Escherichia coli]MDF0687163.1 hypothetical protein [Escherichia coli]
MSNEYQSTSINPDVFEQFFTLLNTHCKSSEAALAMLSTDESPNDFYQNH